MSKENRVSLEVFAGNSVSEVAKFNLRSTLLPLFFATISFAAVAADREKPRENLTCTASQQKAYVFYMYADGFGSDFGCLEKDTFLTQAGMESLQQELQKKMKRKLIIQNVIPLKG